MNIEWEPYICNHGKESDGEHQPELGVRKQFNNLVQLEMCVADTGVVGAKTCYHDVSFSFCESSHSDGIRRKNEADGQAPGDC